MEALTRKRLRLRLELQQAYRAWMRTAEPGTAATATCTADDVSHCPDGAKAKWLAYLGAKERLVRANAERPGTD